MRKTIWILLQVACVLLVGALAMWVLARLREEPKRVDLKEQPIHVTVLTVQPESQSVVVSGSGTARNLNTVAIAPQVAGNIVEIHPRLEIGEVVQKGELLFAIDPRNYELQLKGAQGLAGQLESGLAMLRTKHDSDLKRMVGVERGRDLAKGEHDRVKGLFEKNVGAKHGVELAESAFLQAEDNVTQLKMALDSFPGQLKEMESRLIAAQAQVAQAQLALDNTRVVAPFTGRIKMLGATLGLSVEVGQCVAPGIPVVTLADDSALEIAVPLDSEESRRWLMFGEGTGEGHAWFDKLTPVECTVRWTEDEETVWRGMLNRVQGFDERTRTLTVAVRLEGPQLNATDAALPLVDGMFCEVDIPGKKVEKVYRVPRKAVNFDGTLYLSDNSHLRTAKVEIVHEQGNEVLIAEGLKPGDQVITTRLVNPMENSLLETLPDQEGEMPR